MFVDTIFGIKWRNAVAPDELILIITVIVAVLILYFLYKYYLRIKDRILQERLLFHFKIKQHGLTPLQVKIVDHIIETKKIKNSQVLFTNRNIFESSIGDILTFLAQNAGGAESHVDVCKEIIITYEKLYHYSHIRKPIKRISEIDEGMLLFFYLEPTVVYIGKIIEKTDIQIKLGLFRDPGSMQKIEAGKNYNFYLWRTGDAEYSFQTIVNTDEEGYAYADIPDDFIRGREVRHPYINVAIPCTLSVSDQTYKPHESEPEIFDGTIIKLNEHEVVIECTEKLDYRNTYTLNFTLDEFKINTTIDLIADKTISQDNVHYYTCKLTEISEAARAVLHKLVNESL